MRTPEPVDPAQRRGPELWSGAPLPDGELVRRWQTALLAAGAGRGGVQNDVQNDVQYDDVHGNVGSEGPIAGRGLLDRWRQPHRHYHDLEHLSEVLLALDVLSAPPGAAQLAAFFHDAVYRGRPGDDEQLSAALAEQLLGPLLPVPVVSTVVAAVLATHDHTASTPTEQALNDADLAILAAPQPRYARYRAGVRAEYANYSDAEFTAGRRVVLADLLSRPRLFTTEVGHRLWEQRARANLAAELSGQPSG